MLQLDGFLGICPDRYEALHGNLYYQVAVCRLQYYRHPFKMPDADDIEGLADVYKTYWNTSLGKATKAAFILNYKEYVL